MNPLLQSASAPPNDPAYRSRAAFHFFLCIYLTFTFLTPFSVLSAFCSPSQRAHAFLPFFWSDVLFVATAGGEI